MKLLRGPGPRAAAGKADASVIWVVFLWMIVFPLALFSYGMFDRLIWRDFPKSLCTAAVNVIYVNLQPSP